MTREEAIKALTIERASHSKGGIVEAALDMAISALREQPRWISVEDRLPLAFVPILICHRKGVGAIVEQGYRDIDGRWKVHGTRTGGITHWMPLPSSPEEA